MAMVCAILSLDIAASLPLEIQSEVSSLSQRDDRNLKNRIIGGTIANAQRYPYYTYLAILFQSGSSAFCGGSLVHPDIVLTAAHCIEAPYLDPIVQITALVNYTQSLAVTDSLTGFEHSRLGNSFTKHQNYDSTQVVNDVALVYLDSPVYGVTPVNLNDNGNVPSVGDPVTVFGHGRISNAATPEYPQYLMEVTVPVVSFQDCNGENSYAGMIVDQSMICAGASWGGEGSCKGDSGGPWIIRGNSASEDVQVGIVSFGSDKGCSIVNYPSVFTRVSTYTQWVRDLICLYSTVKPASCLNVAQSTRVKPTPKLRPTPAPTVRKGRTRLPTPQSTEAPIVPNAPVNSPAQSPFYSYPLFV